MNVESEGESIVSGKNVVIGLGDAGGDVPQASGEVHQCRSCGAPVFWLRNITTGKVAPIDAGPTERGNVEIVWADLVYAVVPRWRLDAAREAAGGRLYTSHFITCPQSRFWKHMGSGMSGGSSGAQGQ